MTHARSLIYRGGIFIALFTEFGAASGARAASATRRKKCSVSGRKEECEGVEKEEEVRGIFDRLGRFFGGVVARRRHSLAPYPKNKVNYGELSAKRGARWLVAVWRRKKDSPG